MPALRIQIEQFLQLSATSPVIDVRSPAEFNHAHIPGAVSIPLFTDEERKTVGTAYKQESREIAIKHGLDFFGPKMRSIVEQAEALIKTGQPKILLVYCWRGGMRSGAVSWLLDTYGFKVYTLAGGYKKYRQHVLDTFKRPFKFKLLGGYTGSGKTELLKAMKEKGFSIIDLENIASHKGSAFGNIGMPDQPGQEMFENLLAAELNNVAVKGTETIWMEDESQRIGLVNLPGDLWATMRNSPVVFLDINFEERLKHIVLEYGCLDKTRLKDAIGRIREKLGGLNAKTCLSMLDEGDIEGCFRILLKYYDKFYLKGLHNRKDLDTLLHRVEATSVGNANVGLFSTQYLYQHENH